MSRLSLLPALLAVSLLANGALLLALRTSGSTARPTSANATSSRPALPTPPSRGTPSAAAPSPEAAAALGEALNSKDPARLRDLLLAAGVEPGLMQQLVSTAVWRKYEARFNALNADNEPDLNKWWQPDERRPKKPNEQRELNQLAQLLRREVEAEITALTAPPDPSVEFNENSWLRRSYSALSTEKAFALRRIEQDYEEILSQAREANGDFELPSDREALRLLNVERERDIAALLTSDERAAHDLRSSPTAERVRYRLNHLDPSLDEYLKIYSLQKAYDDVYEQEDDSSPPGLQRDQAYWDRRNTAEKAVATQIRSLVGDTRHLAAIRLQDGDYTAAFAASVRLGLPDDTPDRLYALRTPAAAASQRIAADPALTPDQKKAALKSLASSTRAVVERTLGLPAATSYFQTGAMPWLESLQNGTTLTLDQDNNVQDGPSIE